MLDRLTLTERVARLEEMAHPPVDLTGAIQEALTGVAASRDFDGSMTRAYFVIVMEPDRAPEKKRPMQNSHRGLIKLLRELIACRREGVRLVACRVTADDDLWVDDGHGLMVEEAIMAGFDLPDDSLITLRMVDGGWEIWRRASGRRHPRKVGGPFARASAAVAMISGPIWSTADRAARNPASPSVAP